MSDKQKENGVLRTLDLYTRLCEGKVINKQEEAQRYCVSDRTIQRDMDAVNTFFSNRNACAGGDAREIKYSRKKNGYVLEGAEASEMSNSEILAVVKILLESRAFSKQELSGILDKMVEGCAPLKDKNLVCDLIANEKFHYVELHHKSLIEDKLWDLGENIAACNLMEIRYTKAGSENELVTRIIEPVAVLFSEYYFYLNAYIVEKDDKGNYVWKYDYPAIFRLDRIIEYRSLEEKFKISYVNRFQEGDFRKRIQFMYAGELMHVQMKFYGKNPEPVLDRLPTAEVKKELEDAYLIEAEVYGTGIVMWLLSQGSRIEVLKPAKLRTQMKAQLEQMLERYIESEQ